MPVLGFLRVRVKRFVVVRGGRYQLFGVVV